MILASSSSNNGPNHSKEIDNAQQDETKHARQECQSCQRRTSQEGQLGWKHSAKTASAGKGASGKKVNPALTKPLQPSNELAAVVGSKPLPRPEVVSKVWDYIKRNNLQNPSNKREINADDKLRAVFGKERVTMFEMNKHLAQHLT